MRRRDHMSISTISRFERDERDIPTAALRAIATALNTTPDYLLGFGDMGRFLNAA